MTRKIWRLDLALKSPLITGSRAIATRQTFVICDVVDGEIVWSEAAPLENWGTESLSECLGALAAWCTDDVLPRCPAARFAVDGLRLSRAHAVSPAPRLRCQYTLGIQDTKQTVVAVKSAMAAGFSTIKIKVGTDLNRDVERVVEVFRFFPETTIRVDANGAWNRSQAAEFLQRTRDVALDLVEQPLEPADLSGLSHLREMALAPIAADESANNMEYRNQLLTTHAVDAVVLKPSTFGSRRSLDEYVKRAQEADVRVIFSSAIESTVGRILAAEIAACLAPGEAAGFNTGGWISNDVPGWELAGDEVVFRDLKVEFTRYFEKLNPILSVE